MTFKPLQAFGILIGLFELVHFRDAVNDRFLNCGGIGRSVFFEREDFIGETDRERGVEPAEQIVAVDGLFRFGIAEADRHLNAAFDFGVHGIENEVARGVVEQDFLADSVDDFALLVHNIVVFQRAFTDGEVVLFHPALCRFDGFVQPRVLELFAFFEPEPFHDLHDAVGTENTHQIVFQRNIEAGGAGVALACASSAQLTVDTAGVVAGTADHIKTAEFGNAVAEFDVGAGV